MQPQPTLLNSCARAASAAEARFRIESPDPPRRASRVIALDEKAATVVRRLADGYWKGGHFLVFEAVVPGNGAGGARFDATMRAADGTTVLLSDELHGADVAVVIATEEVSPEVASMVGDACAARRVMSAGLVVSEDRVDGAVAALRPNAMVLLVLKDENDIPPILTALRV
jgi:hypothetical protein